jgi:uncharacterized protein YegP (UPF0339 family)
MARISNSAHAAAPEETAMRFEIHKEGRVHLTSLRSGGGDWRWELLSDAGSIVATGEGFKSKAACREAVELVKTVDLNTIVVDRHD